MRPGEMDGREYHFVSPKDFREMANREEFLEWAEVHGQLYGTSREEVLPRLRAGKDVVLVPHGTDKYGRTLAEVYIDGRRIEQPDIGPRAGRGSGVRYHVRKAN